MLWQEFWRPLSRRNLFCAKTLFLVLFAVLPLVVSQGTTWLALGFSSGQLVRASGGLLLYAVSAVFVAAAVAAWTHSAMGFLRQAGILVVVGVLWTWLVSLAANDAHSRLVARLGGAQETVIANLQTSALVVALIVFSVCSVLAWVTAARLARFRLSRVLIALPVLLLAPILSFWPIDFMAISRLHDTAAPVAVQPERGGSIDPGEQPLPGPLRVTSVPDGHVVALTALDLHAELTYAGGQYEVSHQSENVGGYQHPLLRWTNAANYKRAIRRLFPQDTLWFTDWHTPETETWALPLDLPAKVLQGRAVGHLEGVFTLSTYEVVHRAVMPMRATTASLGPGHTLTIAALNWKANRLSLTMVERRPELLLSRSLQDAEVPVRHAQPHGSWVFVLHHPESGEAMLLKSRMLPRGIDTPGAPFRTHVFSLEVPVPALRYRLAGLSPQAWFATARLHVIEGQERGAQQVSVSLDDYRPGPSPASCEAPDDGAQERVALALPPNPSQAQLGEYLDRFFIGLPERWSSQDLLDLRSKLTAVGAAGVPALLDRLPVEERYERAMIRPVLKDLAREEHLPVLLDAMRRYVDVAWLIREKGWDGRVAADVLALLCQRHVPSSAEAVILAAQAATTAHYSDLIWHVVHLERGHDEVVPFLRRLPEFPVDSTIRRAWQRAGVGLAIPVDIAGPGAVAGIAEALDTAIGMLESDVSGTRRERLLAWLRQAVLYAGPPEGFAAWLVEHRGAFVHDAQSGRFVLAG